jgi:hypothetical protein
MRGAQRRLEARIGQLLGPAVEGQPTNYCRHKGSSSIERHDRIAFRQFAQALNGEVFLSDDEWRNSRRTLAKARPSLGSRAFRITSGAVR